MIGPSGSQGRFEFDGLHPVSMVGSTLNHARIAQNLWRAIDRQLAGTGCEAFIQDGGVATAGGAVRFPDVSISCSGGDGRARLVPDPVAVFEVLSPATSFNDRIIKLEEYRAVVSIRLYAIVEQDSMSITLHRRDHKDGWRTNVVRGGDFVELDVPPLSLPVANIYDRVDFPTEA